MLKAHSDIKNCFCIHLIGNSGPPSSLLKHFKNWEQSDLQNYFLSIFGVIFQFTTQALLRFVKGLLVIHMTRSDTQILTYSKIDN